MATMKSQTNSAHLRALVDMGSNGIRFSISSLQHPTSRIMPTLFQSRSGISLYDAQYSVSGKRIPIDENTISAVLSSFKQFQQTCRDFNVLDEHIKVLATEATRTAINSEDFRARIKKSTGWQVEMLAKEDEGKVGAMGVASSLPIVKGLVMDLGGGSTQLSWVIKTKDRDGVQMPGSGAVSMPYGAAAMSRRLAEAEKAGQTAELRQEIYDAVKSAYSSLGVPAELRETAERDGGFTLYLSGGGFRGWGYVLMSRHHVTPYPIPVINGFRASRNTFLNTEHVKQAAAAALQDDDEATDIFRVSDRRAGQVPAVAFLIGVLAEALPQVKEIRFAQGGVREGYLFSSLTSEIQAQDPLVVATQELDSASTSEAVAGLLLAALPPGSSANAQDDYKSIFTFDLLDAFANVIYYHSSHSKDLQASAGLRSTTSGILAGVHGVQHESRALLGLLLCARWGGDVPPTDQKFKENLMQLVESPWSLWWINYLGAVAALIASIYPAGVVEQDEQRLTFTSAWERDEKQRNVLNLQVKFSKHIAIEAVEKGLHDIEKVGKKKRWIGGRDGVGHKVTVSSAINP
nr:retrograde regulation protein 2-like [Quercus suber]POF15584.1 retrograde regulation protein 2 [Quercus suber]